MTKMSVALMLAFATSSVYAAQNNAYHHEAEIGFLDSSGEADSLVNANYHYYFKAVEQAEKPYELAAFFNQGSTISARYATIDFQDLYNISGQYVFDSNWFVGAGVNQLNFDNDAIYRVMDSDTIYDVNLGFFFTDHSALTLGYSTKSESKLDSVTSDFYEIEYYASEDTDVISLTYEHFIPLKSTTGVFITGEYHYIAEQNIYNTSGIYIDSLGQVIAQDDKRSDDYDNYTVAVLADWYINKAWSVGASYVRINIDGEINFRDIDYSTHYSPNETESITAVNTRYFWHFSDVFSAKFSLEHYFENSEYNSDSETNFGVAINARF
ncbi:hypothetical protein ACED29_14455 [Shewanella sp. 5S214]|uniref:hypothetical protein n=1 Tax=Shewanella sp. 5S214 TaxID=3229999 RepID=UPI00352CFDA8